MIDTILRGLLDTRTYGSDVHFDDLVEFRSNHTKVVQ